MRRFATLLAALGALLLVAASPAFAAGELELKETFGSAAQPTFTKAAGMAVDPATGDLLVIDTEKQTLSRFKANGEPHNFSALGGNTINGAGGADETPQEEILSSELGASFESEVAVAPPSAGATAGYIYVTDALNLVVDVFAPTGEYKGQEEFGYPCGVAVDSAGTVYVGSYEGNAAVYKMSATAAGELNEVAQFPTTTPCLVAAGAGPSAGYVFVAQYAGAVSKLDATTGTPQYAVSTGSTTGLSVDAGSGYVYVAGGEKVVAYDASGASEASEVTNTPAAAVSGVAADGSSHDVYVARSASSENLSVYSQPEPEAEPNVKLTIESGSGTVVSNPAGLECSGAAPKSCEKALPEGSVKLTASPAPGYLFKGWKKCDSGGVNGRICTITATSSLKEVGASFIPAYALEATKSDPNGAFSTKPGGVNCGYGCNSSTALYKEGEVILKTKPAKHFHFVEYTNGTGSAASCNGETTTECSFSMTEDSAIEEVYAQDAKNTLTLSKTGGGQAFIKTKPTSINCGYTCTDAEGEYFFNETAEVSVKLNKGTTSLEWSTGAGTCTGTIVTLEATCTVPMSAAHSLVADLQ